MIAAEKQLECMGFTPELARIALQEAKGDIYQAIEILVGLFETVPVPVTPPPLPEPAFCPSLQQELAMFQLEEQRKFLGGPITDMPREILLLIFGHLHQSLSTPMEYRYFISTNRVCKAWKPLIETYFLRHVIVKSSFFPAACIAKGEILLKRLRELGNKALFSHILHLTVELGEDYISDSLDILCGQDSKVDTLKLHCDSGGKFRLYIDHTFRTIRDLDLENIYLEMTQRALDTLEQLQHLTLKNCKLDLRELDVTTEEDRSDERISFNKLQTLTLDDSLVVVGNDVSVTRLLSGLFPRLKKLAFPDFLGLTFMDEMSQNATLPYIKSSTEDSESNFADDGFLHFLASSHLCSLLTEIVVPGSTTECPEEMMKLCEARKIKVVTYQKKKSS
ncbi:hypothetical protein BT69DRAFT_1319954 [Atractiella rhizophila]|nr:hypothetical protein BT69DRAFT_1319954 [Atractiella rhizophila]